MPSRQRRFFGLPLRPPAGRAPGLPFCWQCRRARVRQRLRGAGAPCLRRGAHGMRCHGEAWNRRREGSTLRREGSMHRRVVRYVGATYAEPLWQPSMHRIGSSTSRADGRDPRSGASRSRARILDHRPTMSGCFRAMSMPLRGAPDLRGGIPAYRKVILTSRREAPTLSGVIPGTWQGIPDLRRGISMHQRDASDPAPRNAEWRRRAPDRRGRHRCPGDGGAAGAVARSGHGGERASSALDGREMPRSPASHRPLRLPGRGPPSRSRGPARGEAH
jgi:hypothetical protein